VQNYLRGCVCTGWRRLIGSPKLQITFRKRATKYRALLREVTYKDKRSYESSPPSMCFCIYFVCICLYIFSSLAFFCFFMRVCGFVCLYINIHGHIHIYICIYIYEYVHMYFVHIHMCIHMRMHTCIFMSLYIYPYTFTHTYTHVYMYRCI